jgi:hypothetical protein
VTRDLTLTALAEGMPGLTPVFGHSLAEACAVCLEEQGHSSGVVLEVSGELTTSYLVQVPEVTDQMRRCWNDNQEATEHGAYGIALLLARDVTGFVALERSRKGTGFDFWLGDEDELPFQNKARLEVSGIRNGNDSAVTTRVNEKLEQMSPTDGLGLPGYAAVIEFGRPVSRVVRKV